MDLLFRKPSSLLPYLDSFCILGSVTSIIHIYLKKNSERERKDQSQTGGKRNIAKGGRARRTARERHTKIDKKNGRDQKSYGGMTAKRICELE